ncbi:MAG: acetyl-CoA carboxylase, carboxyltransferase subunit beta [Planctomycetota bacterium]|nr:acetyl-CoA carboxylase carboxyltransferase subunit beta [Planctomycetota bacterium]MCZ6446159.1 acetyl-CoA carboxylase, carboxyltransferase subunit beta [Planctomycetota bacterium]MCZ6494187.1 acetyl-CoA carboxylase, carboxyltransferase subunit beta [Planctomycetota bacterium]MCZ6611188.1 acetyl-CoA carboxylase, carboxyltransferase subunit beta [Planctomycetota bacterium]MCZ6734423.1 acetyl-CoA carboxylase, carboxyltransferase subunit beta [Planctomycetota bacterium]
MTQAPNRTWADSPELAPKGKKAVPEGLWIRCPDCAAILFRKSVENNLWVCPECHHHFRVSGLRRIRQLVDPESFEPFNERMTPVDPLNFVDLKPYTQRLADAQKGTGQNDGVQTGAAFIKGRKVILACMDFEFLGGSMGSVVGEKITQAILLAADRDLPLVIVSCSGGARMMESGFSLMQMAKTTAALARFDDQGGLFISVLTDPTTGGVTASFAMLGDVILAERKALIGFAGPRVIQQTIRQELPEGFQRAEFVLECGFVDRVVERSELRSEISRIIDYAGK